jgi:hypothetical protein
MTVLQTIKSKLYLLACSMAGSRKFNNNAAKTKNLAGVFFMLIRFNLMRSKMGSDFFEVHDERRLSGSAVSIGISVFQDNAKVPAIETFHKPCNLFGIQKICLAINASDNKLAMFAVWFLNNFSNHDGVLGVDDILPVVVPVSSEKKFRFHIILGLVMQI